MRNLREVNLLLTTSQKKKCDEVRPSCSRCAERGLDCSYEAVRPRQRRKRNSNASSTVASQLDRRLSFASTRRWSVGSTGSAHHDWYHYHADTKGEPDHLISPLDGTFDSISLPTISDLSCSFSPGTIAESAVEFEEDDQAEGAGTSAMSRAVVPHVSKPPDLAMIAPCPVGSPLLDFYIPAFSEFSDRTNRRALVAHFCESLSHLIVFREESGNPFRELVLPLTAKSSPVMNAIYALSSAHMEYRGVTNQEQSMYFHGQAIQGLAALIDQKAKTAENRNELLAAIMLLVYYEVVCFKFGIFLRVIADHFPQLVQRGRSNLVDGHLKGAMTIMNSYPTATDATGIFLERVSRFLYDHPTSVSTRY